MTENQQEARTERAAIMSAEGETEDSIQAVFRAYPAIFGIESREELQERLL